MAQVSDVATILHSGLNHIDALLDAGPAWNFLTPASNTIVYTFSIASGNEEGVGGQQAFDAGQQNNARNALAYISALTGIHFSETGNGNNADLHFAMRNLSGDSATGLCSWGHQYSYDQNQTLTTYNAQAYVYLDNADWLAQNSNLTPGGQGYETLLHELGHALGLKHPFEGSSTLPASQENTAYTLMSYTENGGPYTSFRPYDVAALNWIYGGDGLQGALGINSTSGGRYWTGTDEADTIPAGSSNDVIDGGNGIDTVVFTQTHDHYRHNRAGNTLTVSDTGGSTSETLVNVERLAFADSSAAYDLDGHAGQTAKILGAVFGKESVANTGYAGIGLHLLDQGMSYEALASLALDAAGTSTPRAIVDLLWKNVVGSLPSNTQAQPFVDLLSQGWTAGQLATLAADTDLNQSNIGLVGLAQEGLSYTA